MKESILIQELFSSGKLQDDLAEIVNKITHSIRITPDEALILYEKADLGLLGALANQIREVKNGHFTYFNRNFHI